MNYNRDTLLIYKGKILYECRDFVKLRRCFGDFIRNYILLYYKKTGNAPIYYRRKKRMEMK